MSSWAMLVQDLETSQELQRLALKCGETSVWPIKQHY